MKVLSNNQCKKDYSYPSYLITRNMLCDYVEGGGKDSCQEILEEENNQDGSATADLIQAGREITHHQHHNIRESFILHVHCC